MHCFFVPLCTPTVWIKTKGVVQWKIRMWPFFETVWAKRNSRNRPVGTFEKNPVNFKKDVYCQYLLEKVHLAIREKLPTGSTKAIQIQQDSYKSHIDAKSEAFAQAGTTGAWVIRMIYLPPSSLDIKILDLEFFYVVVYRLYALSAQIRLTVLCQARSIRDMCRVKTLNSDRDACGIGS